MWHTMHVGICLTSTRNGAFKRPLLMKRAHLNTWMAFKQEIIDIRRAQATSSPALMDLGSVSKGGGAGKDKGKKSHEKHLSTTIVANRDVGSECRAAGKRSGQEWQRL